MDQIFDEMVNQSWGSNDLEACGWNQRYRGQPDSAGGNSCVEGKDLDIRVTREAVAIAGEHRYEKSWTRLLRTEFRYGKFQRDDCLPVAVQNDQVQAEFKDGILTLTLPKINEARRKSSRSIWRIKRCDDRSQEPAAEANHTEASLCWTSNGLI